MTSDSFTTNGSGTGSFTSNLSGLSEWSVYYIRAYATNEAGTAYGKELCFVANNPVSDYDGNNYQTIEIGNQIWMAENLNTTHYADGTELTDGTGIGDISGDITTTYYFNYGDSEEHSDIYGKLYSWAAIMNGAASSNANPSEVQGVCPDGWHVPSDGEWKELEMYLGMNQTDADDIGNRGTDEGEKLKETGITYWITNDFSTNESWFTALPGGYRFDNGNYTGKGYSAYFWSATENNVNNAWYRKLGFDYPTITRYAKEKESAFSIRCIKD